MKIKAKIKLAIQNYYIRKRFPDSQIRLCNCFDPKRLELGRGSYGDIRIVCFNTVSRIKIGNYCSIAQDVRFIVDSEHSITTLSSYPFKVKLLGIRSFEAASKGDIVIDDDVWIGYGATILSGVHIFQGAVIAAGAVVTKDVQPYSIVGGVPARKLKNRFDDDIIQELLDFDYSMLDKDDVENNLDLLYRDISCIEDVEQIIGSLVSKKQGYEKRYLDDIR